MKKSQGIALYVTYWYLVKPYATHTIIYCANLIMRHRSCSMLPSCSLRLRTAVELAINYLQLTGRTDAQRGVYGGGDGVLERPTAFPQNARRGLREGHSTVDVGGLAMGQHVQADFCPSCTPLPRTKRSPKGENILEYTSK